MQSRSVRALWFATLLALLASCASTDGAPTVTGATDRAPVRLPDFTDPEDLEKAVVSFGECVEEIFPIVIRFRPDPFSGMSTEVGSQREDEGDDVDMVVAECMGQLDLERRLGVYQSTYPISSADRQQVLDEFISCADAVLPEISELVSEANLDSESSVTDFVSGFRPSDGPADEIVGVSDCYSDMTGPERVFSEGHPWFIP
jgi:hypothetical protein